MSVNDGGLPMTNDVAALARRWLVNNRRGRKHYEDLDIDLDDDVLGLMITDLDPERGWKVVLELLQIAETEEDIGSIAVALLEPLLREHGPRFVDRTDEMAGRDPRFRRALRGIYVHGPIADLVARLAL